jgi:hypothetical protein
MMGVVAAVLASVGDLLLLATANAGRPGFEWLPDRSDALLLVGTYLGIAAIPCYAIGYRQVAERLTPTLRRPLVALGTVGGVIGGTTHGLTGLVIHVAPPGDDPFTVVARYGAYLLPLWALVVVVSVVGSGLYAAAILRGDADVPRWMALVNPVTLTGAFVAIGAMTPAGEAFLVPAAPNLAHVAYFALFVRLRRAA